MSDYVRSLADRVLGFAIMILPFVYFQIVPTYKLVAVAAGVSAVLFVLAAALKRCAP